MVHGIGLLLYDALGIPSKYIYIYVLLNAGSDRNFPFASRIHPGKFGVPRRGYFFSTKSILNFLQYTLGRYKNRYNFPLFVKEVKNAGEIVLG